MKTYSDHVTYNEDVTFNRDVVVKGCARFVSTENVTVYKYKDVIITSRFDLIKLLLGIKVKVKK